MCGSRRIPVIGLLSAAVACMAIAGVFALLNGVRESASRARCSRQLAIIGQAMLSYYQDYGRFPPAYLKGADGKPAHSWRVLLLPYLDEAQLYAQYRFDEAWNGPHNRKIANRIRAIGGCPLYSCPTDESTWRTAGTNYVLVTGHGTMFDGENSTTMAEIVDGESVTLMIVEVTGSHIHWMEPRDLELDAMAFSVGAPTGNNISSHHRCGAQIVFADLTKRCLNGLADEDDIRRLSSIAGRDPLPPSRAEIFD